MGDDMETASAEKSTRKGFHKYFHTSKLDAYICGALAMVLLFFASFRAFSIIPAWQPLSGFDALKLSLLLGIFAVVADIHYKMFEAHYDK
jgi:hypothetical protein